MWQLHLRKLKNSEHRHLAILGVLSAAQSRMFGWRNCKPHCGFGCGAYKLGNNDTLRVRNLVVNVASYQVTIDNSLIYLTYKEFELLRFLLSNRGRVLPAMLSRVMSGEMNIWAAHVPLMCVFDDCAEKLVRSLTS